MAWLASNHDRATADISAMTLHGMVERSCRRHADSVAVEAGAVTVSYGKLWESVVSASGHLQSVGIGLRAGEAVFIFVDSGISAVTSLLSVFQANNPWI